MIMFYRVGVIFDPDGTIFSVEALIFLREALLLTCPMVVLNFLWNEVSQAPQASRSANNQSSRRICPRALAECTAGFREGN